MPEETSEIPQPIQPTESKSFDWPKIILAAILGLGLLAGAAYTGYWFGTQQTQSTEEFYFPNYKPLTPEQREALEKEANDAQRKSDLSNLKSALDAYSKDSGSYPTTLSPLVPKYLRMLPKDPVSSELYNYELTKEGEGYVLTTVLSTGEYFAVTPD